MSSTLESQPGGGVGVEDPGYGRTCLCLCWREWQLCFVLLLQALDSGSRLSVLGRAFIIRMLFSVSEWERVSELISNFPP